MPQLFLIVRFYRTLGVNGGPPRFRFAGTEGPFSSLAVARMAITSYRHRRYWAIIVEIDDRNLREPTGDSDGSSSQHSYDSDGNPYARD